jgi:hypothetical protein
MMTTLGILIVLLITVLIVLKKRKQCPSNETPCTETTTQTSADLSAVSTTVNPQITDAITGLPEDSVLRRHYLTHLSAMIETVNPVRPTDSVLSRHYDTTLVAKMDQCLNDRLAMSQLISEYEKLSADLR